ncbi:RNA polymerase sigma factor [Planobispora takensis]|uniref:DNA-directed RNA polymerase sigma-70 factor n=1 Tax=Planobispora takensis TaxID=1367882 RepID=A0A8J3WUW9_9ACTN|nr:sigma-70 family RNA polymerase sigma factor [Planobispora takensis]GII02063.1 DNA-directed RNA polymerase sigma-70 factor [Planobispora takensis]
MTELSPGDTPIAGRDSDRRSRLATLLGQAAAGRQEALDEIVTDLTPMLWHAVRSQGLDYHTAQDVVQTTWLVLVRHLHTIKTPAALIEWLIITARREAWRVRTNTRREEPTGSERLEEIEDGGRSPDEILLLNEQQQALWSAVALLSQRCRDLLRIVAFVHRPDYAAVAAALGMPRGSIGPTRGRCLAKLRGLLRRDTPGGSR